MEKSLGERIRNLREAAGLTQQQVATAISTGRANYAKMEAGDRDIKTEHCIALAEFFDVSCDYLLRGEDPATVDVRDALGLSVTALFLRAHLKT